MKVSEYEAKSTNAQYTKARQLCEEPHADVDTKKAFGASLFLSYWSAIERRMGLLLTNENILVFSLLQIIK